GSEPLELLQIAARPKHEHAAVPVVRAGAHELRGLLGIGLLDEAGYAVHAIASRPRLHPLYIAVTRLGSTGNNAKRDQLALLRCRQRDPYGLLEGGNVTDDVVRRQYEQDGVRVDAAASLQSRKGRKRYGRSRIASEGLQNERARLDIDLPQLLSH